jgi:hypothetical protein
MYCPVGDIHDGLGTCDSGICGLLRQASLRFVCELPEFASKIFSTALELMVNVTPEIISHARK